VRYSLAEANPGADSYVNPSDFISILVWTNYSPPNEPDWNTHVQPILSQYQKLYSVMMTIVDLGSYESVVGHKAQMQDVFSRPETDPRYMPVTRDLSPAKRNMILRWLNTTGNAGEPNLGPAPVVVAHAPGVLAEEAPPRASVKELGGKSVARFATGSAPPRRLSFKSNRCELRIVSRALGSQYGAGRNPEAAVGDMRTIHNQGHFAIAAVYGPVRTVVWEGWSREAPPYPDQSQK
jgi:hypothetical protein